MPTPYETNGIITKLVDTVDWKYQDGSTPSDVVLAQNGYFKEFFKAARLSRTELLLDYSNPKAVTSAVIPHSLTQTVADVINEFSNPSNLLAKIKNVDGTGSGLDGDTLDGLDSSTFVNKATNITISTAAPSGGADKDMWYKL